MLRPGGLPPMPGVPGVPAAAAAPCPACAAAGASPAPAFDQAGLVAAIQAAMAPSKSVTQGLFGGALDEVESIYQLGHVATAYGIQGSASLGSPVDVVYCHFARPVAFVLTLQSLSAGVTFWVAVTTTVGNAQVVKAFRVTSTARSLRLFGSNVSVTAQVGGNLGGAQILGAITPEDVNPLGELVAEWVDPLGGYGTDFRVTAAIIGARQAASPGFLLGSSGWLQTIGDAGAAAYVMYFDANNLPANGTGPLVALGPLVAGTPFSFDRSLRPSIAYASGLYVATSKTGDTLTASTATMRCFTDYGS